ncbi:MAG: hypothetical protein WD638_08160 [Nitriliruptoraceae bacterium]
MSFTQMMTVRTSDPQQLASLLEEWHRDQHDAAPGYEGARLLADREHDDRFVIAVDFASPGDAQRNNDRPETKAWAEKLQAATDGQPEYHDFEVVFTTG